MADPTIEDRLGTLESFEKAAAESISNESGGLANMETGAKAIDDSLRATIAAVSARVTVLETKPAGAPEETTVETRLAAIEAKLKQHGMEVSD